MKKESGNLFLYWTAFSANLLSLNSSPGFSWTSPTLPKFTSNDNSINPLGRPITTLEESLLASTYNIGCVFGCIIASIVAGKLGLKKTLSVFSIPFFVCYLAIAFARNIIYLYVARVILGISAGCVISVLPNYIAEISEDHNRGFFGSVSTIMGCLGHVLSFGVGPLVSIKTFSYILMIPVSIFFVTFIPFVPETPYYYLARKQPIRAEESLKKIRKTSNVEKELAKLQFDVENCENIKVTWRDILFTRAIRNGLIIASGLYFFQQLMGITAILLYLQPILVASGNVIPSDLASVFIGIVQLLSCILSTFLVDRVGKKILLCLSSIGCSISLFSLGIYFLFKVLGYNIESLFWLPFVSLTAFFVFFMLGYGNIPHIVSGELFTSNVKFVCVSFCVGVHIVLAVAIGVFFPYVVLYIGMGVTFLIFSAFAAISNFFVIFFVPETRGRSFMEIQSMLSR